MTNLLQDLKYALRTLRKNPGFAAAAILVMALGIGANSAIFSVVNSVLLRPLPFSDPDKLVQVWHVPPAKQFPGMTRFSVSPANYYDWKRLNHVFSDMVLYAQNGLTLGGDRPQAITAGAVEPNFFNMLGVQPMLGRAFTAEEAQVGRDKEVILSHKLWRDSFGGDKNIIGREVDFNGTKYTVIGVMGPQFSVPTFAQVWTPLALEDKEKNIRGIHDYLVIGRLKPGVAIEQANAELAQISQALAQEYPVDDKDWGAMSTPLREELVGDVRPALLVLLGAVIFVLLIACANVANLLLARTLGKRHEIAIRVALGADRRRLLQQILSESVMVSLLGGVLGLVLAKFGIALIVGFLSDSLPRASEIGIDGWVLGFTFAVSIVTGIAAGLFPALRFAGKDASEGLKQGVGRAGTESGGSKTRSGLVVAEVSLSLLLLIGAGLMIRTLHKLQTTNAGFDTTSSMVLNLKFPENSYTSQEAYNQALNQMLGDVRRIPGVKNVGMINDLPLTGGSHQPIQAEGHPVVQMSEQLEVAVRSATDGYMNAMGIPIIQGRDLSPSDTANRPAAILISEDLAKQLWPNENAVGKHITLTFMPERGPREVVGVVGNVKQGDITAPQTDPSLYVPIGQSDVPAGYKWNPRDMWTVVKTSTAKPTDVAPSVMRAIHNVNGSLPIIDVFSMTDFLNEILQAQRMNMALLVAFAALALTLATVGIYSVLAYTVRRRVREIGIRMALGAQIGNILRLIVVQGMKPVLVGVVIGLVLSVALGRVVASMVYGVSTTDVVTLFAGSALLFAVAVLASFVPAYRATRVQPVEVLRQE